MVTIDVGHGRDPLSGIYLFFTPSGGCARLGDDFRRRLALATRQSYDRVDELVEHDLLQGAAVHHGVLPSGGTARDDRGCLLASGSCWTRPEATTLATPEEMLAALAPRLERPGDAFGGGFAFAHCDRGSRRLVVENDRFGVMPLFYRELAGGGWAVASELKFLAVPGQEELDEHALARFLGMGNLPGVVTMLAGVLRLPAHHRLTVDAAGARTERLPDHESPRGRPVDAEALAEFDAMAQRYLGRFAAATDRWTVSFSGGLDSRLVAGAAARQAPQLDGFVVGEPGSAEVKVTRRLADRLDVPLHVHTIDGSRLPDWFGDLVWTTELRTPPRHMHYFGANHLGDLPRNPILHGLIGEGIMGGYGDDLELRGATPEKIREYCRRMTATTIFWPRDIVDELFAPARWVEVRTALTGWTEEILAQMDFQATYGEMVELKFQMRAVNYAVPYLLSQILPWQDVVSPFLDKDIYAVANTYAAEDLVDRKLQIRWALEHMPHLAEVPRLKDGVLIPVRLGVPDAYEKGVARLERIARLKYWLCRASKGRLNLPFRDSFPYYGQWFRRWKRVREYIEGILLSEQCLDRGLWRRRGLRRMLRGLREGRSLWNGVGVVLMSELFLRQFVDGTDRPGDPDGPGPA